MPDSSRRPSDGDTDRSFLRREVLTISSVGFASSLAGCNTGADPDRPPRTTDEPRTASATETESPTETGFDASFVRESATGRIGPADGFADVDWLDGSDPAVVKVTTLDGAGEGSLRWAVEQPATRIVVFEVGGVVDLEGEHLTIDSGQVFVAGQTAPEPGITLVRGGLSIEADDVLVQHLRVRPGDDIAEPTDCITNYGGSNVIVDHCSASWGTDETISTTAGSDRPNITLSNNLMAECLVDSIHPKGPHSMGTLLNDRSRRVAVLGNLWAHNVGRHPRIKGGTSVAVANNVAYNFERATNLGGGVDDETTASIVGNYYRAGPLTDTEEPVVGTTYTDARGPITAFIAYNETDPSSMPVTKSSGIERTTERPLWPEGFTAVRGADAYEPVLAAAGARPAARTEHDARIVADVRARSGGTIDSQSEVGGYPDHEETSRELSVPDSGLGDWLHEFTSDVERPPQ